ncbi:MAG: alpha/beta hydrolase [Chlamydiia bacterium]|nr:alpha/beta hydrolase [Chlamydiia bacterium]
MRETDRLTDYIQKEEWPSYRNDFVQWMQPLSDAARDKYIEGIEEGFADGVRVLISTPNGYRPEQDDKVLVYFHGGAYALGAPDCQLHLPAPVAFYASLRCVSVDYPLAPEHPFPEAHDACFKVYCALAKRFQPEKIVLMGDSAGGSLALATALKARDAGVPLPGAIIAYSPACDLLQTSPTYNSLGTTGLSRKLTPEYMRAVKDLLSLEDEGSPYASPLYADYTCAPFPPVMITTGSLDLLQGECALLAEKLQKAGVNVHYFCDKGLWHNFQEEKETPESVRSAERAAQFIKQTLQAG